MFKKIIIFILAQMAALVIGCVIVTYLIILLISLLIGNTCDKERLEAVTSPNKKYKIVTYKVNCGATVDFSIIGELCTKDNNCKEIYNCYHEQDSYVYWINDKTVSINNKILNIHKDKYNWKNDDDYQEHLYKK